jgi:hypothetical protein
MEQLEEWMVVVALFSVVGFSVALVMLISDYVDGSSDRTKEGRGKPNPSEWKANWKKVA